MATCVQDLPAGRAFVVALALGSCLDINDGFGAAQGTTSSSATTGSTTCDEDGGLGILPTLELGEQTVVSGTVQSNGDGILWLGRVPTSLGTGATEPDARSPMPIAVALSEGPLLDVCLAVQCEENPTEIVSEDCEPVTIRPDDVKVVRCCGKGQVEARYACNYFGGAPATAVIDVSVSGPEACVPYSIRVGVVP